MKASGITRKDAFVAAGLSAVSVGAAVGLLMLAEFGASQWALIGLLAWLLTAGLPTLIPVLVLASIWPGPSFGAFVVSAIVVSFVLYLVVIVMIRRFVASRRSAA